MIKLENVSFKYINNEPYALNNVSFTVNDGEWVSVLGHNGSGKSTIAKLLIGLLKPVSGKIFYDDIELEESTVDIVRKKVGIVFQNPDNQFVGYNVKYDIAFGLENHMIPREEMLNLINEYTARVGMENELEREPQTLSGGQKQRVAIARALMSEPEILLSDEATSALDPDTTNQVLSLLKELNQKLGLTIIMISHQMDVIEKICNKVAIIDNSKIVESGETQEIFLYPKTEISKKIIYSGHINTKSDDSKLLKVIFNGELDTPLIANIVQDCNIVLSVIYADSKVVNDRVYGQLIFKMPADIDDVNKLRKYLELNKVHYKEVDASEFI